MGRLLPVTESWGSVLGALIPLGFVIALSPITVIPAVLVLQAPRPRPTGLAFLVGWVLGLAALTAISVAGSGLLGGLHKPAPRWASWLRVILGAALIVYGIYQWFTRHRHTDSPAWMRSFATHHPAARGAHRGDAGGDTTRRAVHLHSSWAGNRRKRDGRRR